MTLTEPMVESKEDSPGTEAELKWLVVNDAMRNNSDPEDTEEWEDDDEISLTELKRKLELPNNQNAKEEKEVEKCWGVDRFGACLADFLSLQNDSLENANIPSDVDVSYSVEMYLKHNFQDKWSDCYKIQMDDNLL